MKLMDFYYDSLCTLQFENEERTFQKSRNFPRDGTSHHNMCKENRAVLSDLFLHSALSFLDEVKSSIKRLHDKYTFGTPLETRFL